MIALFGWAVCAYIPALFLPGVFLLLGRKPRAGKTKVFIYGLCFASAVCTLHILLAKSLIQSERNYILAPFGGYATVGGALASVLTSPFVLVTKDFGLSLALSFLLTAAFIFMAIYPYILKMKDGKPRKKSSKTSPRAKIDTNPIPKESALYISRIEDTPAKPEESASNKIFEPREPYEQDASVLFSSLLSPEEAHNKKARDSSRILFNNEDPKKEEKPKLKVLDYPGKNYFSNKAYHAENETIQKTFGQYDAQADYRMRYGKQEEKPQGRTLNGYPEAFDSVAEPVSPRLSKDAEVAAKPQTPPPPPKPKKVITNPKEYIITPLRPEEYLQMVSEDTQGYQIPHTETPVSNNSYDSETINRYESQEKVYPEAESRSSAACVAATTPVAPNFFGSDLKPKPLTPPAESVAYPSQDDVEPSRPLQEKTEEIPLRHSERSSFSVKSERSGFAVKAETMVPPPVSARPEKPIQQTLFGDNRQVVKPFYRPKKYIVPPLDLLRQYPANGSEFPEDYAIYKAKIEETMEEFNIPAMVTDAKRGPTFTRYELKLGPGCNIKKIATLQENLTMRLEVQSIRILTPITGKNAFGIEIPNKMRDVVGLRSILASQKFMTTDKGIQFAMGKTLEGEPYVANLAAMPHLLVAGATGTGKSVFINQVIISILYKYSPEDVRLILIDPKKVELSIYQNLPNLLIRETVKEAAHATNLLNWLTKEMDDRFSFLEKHGAVDIDHYNNDIRDKNTEPKIFRIVLVVDEMADLMMKGRGQVEEPIVRIAQLGRACGIHLILATQRPTVNVITGLIKGNILARVAFSVKTAMDSRIILDEVGAESLLGKGDLIYSFKDISLRMQGSLIEPEDIRKVCNYIKVNNEAEFDEQLADQIKSEPRQQTEFSQDKPSVAANDKEQDFEKLLRKILRTFVLERRASVSMAQAKHSVGYIKAKKLIDAMTERGFISAEDGSKPREVLITPEEYEELFDDENAEG
ncbi:MAG: DNA translocase FtsK [Clostridia bacterium]|nr:DNA translocase FtsK [Clostridia bacterium]